MSELTIFFNFRKYGMILTGKTEGLGEKPVPVPLCAPQIPLD
jgi:hypothetical protein